MDSGSGTRTSMSKRDKRDAAVAELLNTEATYVSDMKVRGRKDGAHGVAGLL